MKKAAIVFAPHPDDETLGCGGTIARKLREGYDVYTVFMTDGRHALTDLGIYSEPTPRRIKDMRRKEAMSATRILGIQESNIFFLDFEDKALEHHEEQVQEKIVQILDEISPVEVFFPQEKEYNVDHRATNIVVRRAIKLAHVHPFEYRYIIAWAFPFYSLLHVMNEKSFDFLMSKVLGSKLVNVDVSEFLHLKEMAIKKYRSQTIILSNEQKKPALTSSFLKRFLRDEEKFFIRNAS